MSDEEDARFLYNGLEAPYFPDGDEKEAQGLRLITAEKIIWYDKVPTQTRYAGIFLDMPIRVVVTSQRIK